MRKLLVLLGLTVTLTGCATGPTDVGDGMVFAEHDGAGYTGLYVGNGTEPVIPGGCDSAKWNDAYVLTKGAYWRYRVRQKEFNITQAPADSLVYFVVNKKQYSGRQELDPALHGPLTRQERVAWERRIPGPYHVPE
jgi:hypothetical protein